MVGRDEDVTMPGWQGRECQRMRESLELFMGVGNFIEMAWGILGGRSFVAVDRSGSERLPILDRQYPQ
jgi:hypothetical protein